MLCTSLDWSMTLKLAKKQQLQARASARNVIQKQTGEQLEVEEADQHAEDEASTVPAAAPATTLDGAKVDVPTNAVAVGDAV